MARYIQGKFKPKNPHKYRGDVSNAIYRSSWELRLMTYLDTHPEIEWWASEELVIPYISPIDGKMHRYFTDFVVKKSNGEVMVIEVKPAKQTAPPKIDTNLKGKPSKSFLKEVETWGINSSKWEAASDYCRKKGWKFVIMTEKDLNIGSYSNVNKKK